MMKKRHNQTAVNTYGCVKTPYYSLTYSERVIYVLAYGLDNPIQMQKMKAFLKDISEGTYKDLNGNECSAVKDFYNIIFLSFTADETAKKVFFEYIDKIEVGSWDTNDTSCWGPDKTNKTNKRFVYLDLGGYDYIDQNGNRKKAVLQINNSRGAYVTVFHEIGHAIDDLYKDGKDDAVFSNEKYNLTLTLVSEVRKDCEERLNSFNYQLSQEEINQILNTYVGKAVKFNGVNATGNDPVFANWSIDMQKAYQDLEKSYSSGNNSWSQKDSGAMEGLTDAYFGCVGVKGACAGELTHWNDSYWHDKDGKLYNSPGNEFFAEMFSYQMTNSPKSQIDNVQYDIKNGKPDPGVFYDSYSVYSAIIEEMERKSNG